MKSAVVALVTLFAVVVGASAAVATEEIICPDLIKDPKAIDSAPINDFKNEDEDYLKGGFFFNKTGKVYRLHFGVLLTDRKRPNLRVLTLRDDQCGSLKLQYVEDSKTKTFKAQSAQLLLVQSGGDLALDCSVHNADLYFGAGKQYGKQFIDCSDASGANTTTLIVKKFELNLDN